ncbi:MAG: ABC transporter ATP-binding protein [Veillonella sp.]|uniref:ABC transporter ATP-binding protein n=1 Tax=Veillonella sp. TaxID=1926307 RepID=UPI0025EBB633|nr:ABC transporter ATP-binding protein [Veillonella sp.]MBS4913379.1 ABC transporter ATP-binding protein [Veillonella sp.]
MIEFKNVSKVYNKKPALQYVSMTIESGEFFVLVGTSGSGKTTTLKMINRLLTPTEGTVCIDGENTLDMELRTLRLRIGYVLQTGALFPNLTVAENIEIIPEMKGWPKEERLKTVKTYLNMVGLDPEQYMNRYPRDLSGGEQQRVGILRAIITKPDILLMDEPFSALDPISRNQLQKLIKSLHETFKMTIVFVTHDMAEAVKLGTRICVMSKGEVVQLDTPQQIKEHPAHEVVQRFFYEE